jgi:hypothetical protein
MYMDAGIAIGYMKGLAIAEIFSPSEYIGNGT